MAREEGQVSDDARDDVDDMDDGKGRRKVRRAMRTANARAARARAREREREQNGASCDARVGAVPRLTFARDDDEQGRGYDRTRAPRDREHITGEYETVDVGDDDPGGGANDPVRSVEGWILVVSGVHEEAREDDVHDAFADFGDIKNLHLNLDRRTGFVKGYAFIEYAEKKEAQAAIDAMHGAELFDVPLSVAWAFVRGAPRRRNR